MFSIYLFIELILLVVACYICFKSGKVEGATDMAMIMLEEKIINASHLSKLVEKIK
tara:strand:+ start:1571 stop:1738 length:168 start_codon:yes stop_codon:yes gene_type:complete